MDKNTLERKLKFIESYKQAINAASGSQVDSNANVISKNIATMSSELSKPDFIAVNRALVKYYLEKRYGTDLCDQFEADLKNHIIYSHDETSIMPYCVAISLYPFLLNGLKDLGGTSGAPKHSDSYIGGLTNLIFLIAGQFAGAVAVPEMLPYMDHFLRVDYGDDYINHLDEQVEAFGNRRATLRNKIEDLFQQFVYCINQPAGARGYQSPFTNIAYFDEGYFNSIFKDFIFPDGDEPNFKSTAALQKMFMKWFNAERCKDTITFPVETFNLLHDGSKFVDEASADLVAEMWSEGHSFFLYNSDSADALSSCCRLKNAIEDNVFSYTLGAGGIETGSKKVITLNINRIVQNWYRENVTSGISKISLAEYISGIVSRVHKYLEAWNDWLWELYNAGLLTVYTAGFISLDKQYLTVGINGFLEGAEFLKSVNTIYNGLETKPNNDSYKLFAHDVLNTIKELNLKDRTEHCKFNTELVPAENAGAKLYAWDKKDGYWVPAQRNLYNSYFYPVEDETYDPITKSYLQGRDFIGNLDGGSAYHCNLSEHLSKEQYRKIMDVWIKCGCSYGTFNIPNTICNDCGYRSKHYFHKCPECGSTNLDYETRIIGYLRRYSNFSAPRIEEASIRYYAPSNMIGNTNA